MTGLTWIHLSDWHQKGPDFNRKVVRDALLEDLRSRADIHPSLARVDLFFFSGDIAHSASRQEYESATREFFQPVLEVLAIAGDPKDRVWFVPGNHDLDRTHVREMLPLNLQSPLSTHERVCEWLADPRKRDRALEPFQAYRDFVQKITGRAETAYAGAWTGFIGQHHVGIACFNSAWMCGRNTGGDGRVHDHGFLVVGEPQIVDGLGKIGGADFRIAMLHHPFDWLSEFDREPVSHRVKEACHFVLLGHEHQPRFCLQHDLAGECALSPAGASYDRRIPENPRNTNAYNWVHLDPGTGDATIFFRRWSEPQGKWIADTEASPDGKRSFRIPKGTGTPSPKGANRALSPAPSPGTGESQAIHRHRERLTALTSEIDLGALGHRIRINLPIRDAYVPLNVSVTRSLQRRETGKYNVEALRMQEEFHPDVRLEDVFKWTAKFQLRGVLLLGDPGAGKTTGARQFCWRVLTDPNLTHSLGLPEGTIPVLLRLRNLTPGCIAAGLEAFVVRSVAAPLADGGASNPATELFARDGILWIFDGLDEVVSVEARVQVCGWIREALQNRPKDHFMVTSRYQGYQGPVDLGAEFCEFHVQPLTPDQWERFVECWYTAAYRRLYGSEPGAADRAAARARRLLDILRQPDYRIGRLARLPENPLLLTILCLVHYEDQELPRGRAELYRRCIQVLVGHWWREARQGRGTGDFNPTTAEAVLSAVAWWLHEEEGRVTHGLSELGGVATKAMADAAPSAGLGRDGEAFIRRMRDECGVLAMWSAGQCGFLHLTFQEYLAANHAAQESKAGELAGHFGESWWREVTLLACALGSKEFASRFFSAVIEGDRLESHGEFVDRCLAEAQFPVLDPFLAALESKPVSTTGCLSLLRRLLPFAAPDNAPVRNVCLKFIGDSRREVSSLAIEILQRCGQSAPVSPAEVAGTVAEQRVDSKTGMTFVRIPAGEFLMGSERGTEADERPVRQVRIPRSFLLGKYPVTNEEYERFLRAHPQVPPPAFWGNSQFNGPRQPVVGVSWEEATAYCRWASCRLPTEAEWEYACRAGSPGDYCFGDQVELLGEYAWYSGNSGGRTREVGQKKANAWGLHDLHGNVWEWCQDWYARYAANTPTGEVEGPPKGTSRVVRGGSWGDGPAVLRSAYRNHDTPGYRFNGYLGFRCVWVEVSSP